MLPLKIIQGKVVLSNGRLQIVAVLSERHSIDIIHCQCDECFLLTYLSKYEAQLLNIATYLFCKDLLIILYRHLVVPDITFHFLRHVAYIVIAGESIVLGKKPLYSVVSKYEHIFSL